MKGLGDLNLLFPLFPMKSRSERGPQKVTSLGYTLLLADYTRGNLCMRVMGIRILNLLFCLIERLLGKLIFDTKLKYSVFKK